MVVAGAAHVVVLDGLGVVASEPFAAEPVEALAQDAFDLPDPADADEHGARAGGFEALFAVAFLEVIAAPGTPHHVAEAREAVARLSADGSPRARAVLLVGEGWTISAAARRTGISRASIYQAMAQLAREHVDR